MRAKHVAEIRVLPATPFFEGHFPGLPILPGVAQIDWMIWLSRVLLGTDAPFAGMEAVKFHRVIRPGERVQAAIQRDASGDKTLYRISVDGQVCASGRICWGRRA